MGHGPVHEQINAVNKLIDKHPDSLLLYFERGVLYQIDENLELAITDFKKVLSMDPKTHAVYFPLAELYFQQDRLSLAGQHIRMHTQFNPRHAKGHALFGEIHLALGIDSLAIVSFENVIKLKGQNASPSDFLKLSNLLKKEQPRQAYAVLEKGVAILSPIITIQAQMVELSNENKWYTRSMKVVNEILTTVDRKEYWLLQKADILKKQGKHKLAQKIYKNCLAEIDSLKPKTKETDYVKEIAHKANTALMHL